MLKLNLLKMSIIWEKSDCKWTFLENSTFCYLTLQHALYTNLRFITINNSQFWSQHLILEWFCCELSHFGSMSFGLHFSFFHVKTLIFAWFFSNSSSLLEFPTNSNSLFLWSLLVVLLIYQLLKQLIWMIIMHWQCRQQWFMTLKPKFSAFQLKIMQLKNHQKSWQMVTKT